MSLKKIASKVSAAVIAIVYGAGEIPEVWLGMEEVLKAYGDMSEETAAKIGLIAALTIGLVASTQAGILVYFHAMKKLNAYMQSAQHAAHDEESCSEHDEHNHHEHAHDDNHKTAKATPSCSETARKILAYAVMGLGMFAQFGLSAAAWDQTLTHINPNVGLGWRIGVPGTLALGRAGGNWLFHGHHTYKHIADNKHRHAATAQNQSDSLSSCGRVILSLTMLLYLALWIGHAGQANFEIVETREYGLHLSNQTNALNQDQHPIDYWLVRIFELFMAIIIGLQMAFVEGHHVRELGSNFSKFWKLPAKEKVASAGSAVLGAVTHTLPEVSGLMMIGKEWKLKFGAMMGLVVPLGALELFIATALHLPYNIKIASWFCQSKDDHYTDVPDNETESSHSSREDATTGNAGEEESEHLDPIDAGFTAVSKQLPTYKSVTFGSNG